MKTTYKYDHYFKYDEMTTILQELANKYPKLTKLESICKTQENKDVWAFTITDDINLASIKPAFYIDGNHHAGEVTGSMACMHTLDYLISNQDNQEVKGLLAKYTFYFIPRISPDGAEAYLTSDAKLRSVNRMYPESIVKPGFYPQDIDNDGSIRKMRIKSPTGSWKISKLDSRLMERRKPDDIDGEYYHVFEEGMVYDYDGLMIKHGPEKWGLDFNRNYPFGWFSEHRQNGAGKYPLSNPENKAVVEFVLSHSNIGSALTMHTTGGMIVYPPGTKPASQACQRDMAMYRKIGEMATEEMDYPCMNIFDSFLWDKINYSSGAFDDWMYHTQGIPTYTVELWNLHQRAGVKEVWPIKEERSDEESHSDEYKVLKWIDENLETDAYKPWTKVNHPSLGEIEVGGIDVKFIHQNCPNQFLLQEMEKTTKFTLRNAKVLPMITLDSTNVNKLSDNMYEVKVVISNIGYLPTYCCDEAKEIKVNKPIEVTIDGNFKLIKGQKVEEIAGLNGYGYVSTGYGYEGIESNFNESQKAELTYIIETTSNEIQFRVASQKAGQLQFSISLDK